MRNNNENKLCKNDKMKILNAININAELTNPQYKGYTFSREKIYEDDWKRILGVEEEEER